MKDGWYAGANPNYPCCKYAVKNGKIISRFCDVYSPWPSWSREFSEPIVETEQTEATPAFLHFISPFIKPNEWEELLELT